MPWPRQCLHDANRHCSERSSRWGYVTDGAYLCGIPTSRIRTYNMVAVEQYVSCVPWKATLRVLGFGVVQAETIVKGQRLGRTRGLRRKPSGDLCALAPSILRPCDGIATLLYLASSDTKCSVVRSALEPLSL